MNDPQHSAHRAAASARDPGPLALVAAGALAALLLNLLLLYDLASVLAGRGRSIAGEIVDAWEPSCWATLGLLVGFALLALLQATFRSIAQGTTRRLANLSLVLSASGLALALLSHAATSFAVWGRFKLW